MNWHHVRLTEERAILDAPPAHIDLEAFRFYLQRLGIDTTSDPQPDSEDDLTCCLGEPSGRLWPMR